MTITIDICLVHGHGAEIESMLHFRIIIPAYQVIINPCAADIADVFSVLRPEYLLLIRISIYDWIVCTVVGMKLNFIFSMTPLSVESHVIGRHGAERVWIT